MANTGFIACGTAVNVDYLGGSAWGTPSNAQVRDGTTTNATVPPDGYSDWLRATNFGFSALVPSGATIDGIIVRIRRYAYDGTGINDCELYLWNGSSAIGSNKADIGTPWPNSLTDKDYGSSTDKWGATLTDTLICSSGFGVQIWVGNSDEVTNRSARVDVVEMCVYYTAGTIQYGAATLSGTGILAVIGRVTRKGAATLSGTGSLSAVCIQEPVAITQPESNVGQTTARINGKISNDGGASCEARFWWSLKGLVGHWKLNEDPAIHGTTIVDSSIKGNNGTLSTGDGSANKSVTGKINKAIDFDGTNDRISLGYATHLGFTSEDFTILAWVKADSISKRMRISNRGSWNLDGYRFELWATGKIDFYTFQSGAYQQTYSYSSVIPLTTWVHVAVVRVGSVATIYVNGIDQTQVHATHVNPAYSATRIAYIGSDYDTEAFDGVMDDVRVYNRALSAGEIGALYNSGNGTEEGVTITDWQNTLVTDSTYYKDLTGLTQDTEYEYQTQAKNGAGEGEWSSSEYFITHIQAQASLSGVGSLAANGVVTFVGKATLSGTGTLAAVGKVTRAGKATLSGTGSLAAIGKLVAVAKATLSGVGTLVAAGKVTFIGKATLSGAGSLSAIGQRILTGSATLSGAGTLAASAKLTLAGKATLSGTGSLAAIGIRGALGKATLSGTGSLSGIAKLIVSGKATLSGTGSLVANAKLIIIAKATLSGTGSLTAIGKLIVSGKATLSGTGSLSAIGTLGGVLYGAATLSGTGTLAAVGTITAFPEGWEYYAPITIANGSADYQTKVTVYEGSGTNGENVVYCGGHCKPDFSDLRFTGSDFVTLLDYWIESITGTTPNQVAIVWVQNNATPSTTGRMYYGNPGATAVSNGGAIFPLFDDCNRANSATVGGGWTEDEDAGVGALSIDANTLKIIQNENYFCHIEKAAPTLSDLVLHGKIKIGTYPGGSWRPGIFVYWGSYDWCSIGIGQSATDYRLRVLYNKAGTLTDSAAAGQIVSLATWYYVRLRINSTTVYFEYSTDGANWTQVATFESTARPASWSGNPALILVGKGISVNAGSYPNADLDNSYATAGTSDTHYADDIFVRKYAATEPSFAFGSEGDLHYGAAILSGTGSLSAIGTVGGVLYGAATLSGTGSLSSSAKLLLEGVTSLDGIGSLSVIGKRIYSGASSLTGVGTLTATGEVIAGGEVIEGTASLEGIGSLSALGSCIFAGVSSLIGEGTLTIKGWLTKSSSATLEGVGSLIISSIVYKNAEVSLTGAGTLETASKMILGGVSALQGVGVLTASGELIGWITAQASLEGIGLLTTIGACVYSVKSELTGIGTLTTSAKAIYVGESALKGVGTLIASPTEYDFGAASIQGIGTLLIAASLFKSGASSLVGIGSLAGRVIVLKSGRAVIIGTGTLAIAATLLLTGQATMLGVGTLMATWSEAITRHIDWTWKLPDRDLTMAIPARDYTMSIPARGMTLKVRQHE